MAGGCPRVPHGLTIGVVVPASASQHMALARMLSFLMLVVFILILSVESGSSDKDAEADGEQIMPRSSGD